jgi:hypothetical protein
MTYTLSVLKEALRKYSVVPVVTRTLATDDELLGHKVPAGTMIACVLQVRESYKNSILSLLGICCHFKSTVHEPRFKT